MNIQKIDECSFVCYVKSFLINPNQAKCIILKNFPTLYKGIKIIKKITFVDQKGKGQLDQIGCTSISVIKKAADHKRS